MWMVDAHCDTLTKTAATELWQAPKGSQSDLFRISRFVDLQFCAFFLDDTEWSEKEIVRENLRLVARALNVIAEHGDELKIVRSKEDLKKLAKNSCSLLFALEGAHLLGPDLWMLDIYFALGFRSLGLTWNHNNRAAAGCADITGTGLSAWGKELIAKAEALGIAIDLAHASETTFWQTMAVAKKPLLVSHACCAGLYQFPLFPRNLTDEQIVALAAQGGVMGITFVPDFLSKKAAGLDQVLCQIDHAVKVGGIEHVGIGSDFDGAEEMPVGLAAVESLAFLPQVLWQRGYDEKEIEALLGGNFLRILQEILP